MKHNLLEPNNILTACDKSVVFQSDKEALEEIQNDLRNKINNGEKITERTVYETLGFDVSYIPFPDERLDCYGWDKKGFRRLYKIGLVPIGKRKDV